MSASTPEAELTSARVQSGDQPQGDRTAPTLMAPAVIVHGAASVDDVAAIVAVLASLRADPPRAQAGSPPRLWPDRAHALGLTARASSRGWRSPLRPH